MGISATQFWRDSANGKSMLTMLAQRGDVELVRDACEWLVRVYQKDLEVQARQKGATQEQAKTAAENTVDSLFKATEAINDRSCVGVMTQIVDLCFQRHYNAGKQQYDRAMAWFADELRQRVKD